MSLLEIANSYELEHVLKHALSVAFLLAGLYAVHRWLLPKPLPGIPFNPEGPVDLG